MDDTTQLKNFPHFLRVSQVLELIPVSKSTWWAGVKSGRFPKPVKLGPSISVWKSEDIAAYIEEASNASD